MTIKMLSLAVMMISALDVFAYQFTLEGTVGGKYPIVIEVDRNSNGAIYGRYAYLSTLNKLGRYNSSSWLYIKPDGDSNQMYIITDVNGKVEEHWDIAMTRKNGINILEGSLVTAKSKWFTVEAKSVSPNQSSDLLQIITKLCPMSYSQALNYVKSNGFTHVKTFKKYYHDFNDDPSFYLGKFSQYTNGQISVYFNTDNQSEFSVWIESDKDYESLVDELKKLGYGIDEEESGVGAVGSDFVYKKGSSVISFWTGGGMFAGYSVTVN